MHIEDIQTICNKHKGVTEDIKWGDHLCFSVGDKMFLVTAPDNVPPTASIKVSDEAFETLPSRKGFIPAPYMARHKWIFIEDISLWTPKQWESYIRDAYTIILRKLPAKKQKEIAEMGEKPSKSKTAKQVKKQRS